MQAIDRLNKWTNAHDGVYLLDIVRFCFGVYLFIKGIIFVQDVDYVSHLLVPHSTFIAPNLIAHYVIMVHLAGGLLAAFGFLTRISMAFHIPILIGAVLINFVGHMNTFNLQQAAISLGLCILFLILGSGRLSVDKSMKLHV